MPNKNWVQNNFYRSKEKIPVNFSIFLPYPNKPCSLLIIDNLLGNTPRQMKMSPILIWFFT